MSVPEEVVAEPDVVGPALAQRGFPTVEEFHAVLMEGHLGRMGCTKLDPPILKGTVTWGVTVRALRRQQMPNGWTKRDAKNLSRTITPDGKRQIVVRSGSEGTGQKNGKPTAKVKKETLALIAANLYQPQLALISVPGSEDVKPEPQTWFLLVRHVKAEDGQRSIYAELSRPDGRVKEGRMVGWLTRIILPRLDIDGDGTPLKVPAPTPEISVPVARRVL